MSSVRRLVGLRMPPVLRKRILAVVGAFVAAGVAYCMLLGAKTEAQPDKYMTGAEWKDYLCWEEEDCGDTSWFFRWNHMVQARINQLAEIVESEGMERGIVKPFRVTMVGDSTMMQQHGVMCAFLGERPGRRFNPEKHQAECCIDTIPRAKNSHLNVGKTNRPPGGRGLCFRHAFQRFATPPDVESLGAPDAVYFGSGLHFLHMCRADHWLEPVRVQGWLNYEKDLEDAVRFYREAGGDNFRLMFMTSHIIQDSKYAGDFAEVLEAYRADDASVISLCENQITKAAGGVVGPDGYGQNEFCRQALMDRNGSEVLNRRSRPVMEKLGVPLVEADLIVKDQAWATGSEDGRHYHPLVPVEVWELMGLLVSLYP